MACTCHSATCRNTKLVAAHGPNRNSFLKNYPPAVGGLIGDSNIGDFRSEQIMRRCSAKSYCIMPIAAAIEPGELSQPNSSAYRCSQSRM